MTVLMRDSTNAFDIPVTTPAVAGYVDGLYRWSADMWARFPASTVRKMIAVSPGTNGGDIGDVETGDMRPDTVRSWAIMRIAAGLAHPCAYVNRANRPAVEAALAGLPCVLWIATLDGTQTVDPGPLPVVAVQYAGEAQTGAHYDESIVYDEGWLGGGMTDDEIRAAIAAAVAPVQAENDAQNNRLVCFAFAQELGRTPTQVELGEWVPIMRAGTWEAFVQQLHDTPEAQSFRASGQADTAGHPGTIAVASASRPLPPAPSPPTIPPHSHSGSVTVT